MGRLRRAGGPWLLAGVVLMAPSGCQKAVVPTNVAARVGEAVVTVEQLQAEVDRRARATGGRLDAQKVLQELIDQEAAYQKAVRSGFLERPETRQAIRTMVVGQYLESREQEVQITNALTPEVLRGYYDLNRARFMRPPAVNAAAIRLEWRPKATEEKKAETLATARALREKAVAEASAQASFGHLAAEHSTDQATRYRGGEMGWMTREQAKLRLPAAAVTELFRLAKAGEVTEPVVTELGIYLLKLIGARGEELRPFDEVRPQIEHELARHRQADREARLRELVRAGLTIQVNQEQVERVVPAAPAPVADKPPRLPKG
jgi:parvulin-like peptidyl-prolyl isomerase